MNLVPAAPPPARSSRASLALGLDSHPSRHHLIFGAYAGPSLPTAGCIGYDTTTTRPMVDSVLWRAWATARAAVRPIWKRDQGGGSRFRCPHRANAICGPCRVRRGQACVSCLSAYQRYHCQKLPVEEGRSAGRWVAGRFRGCPKGARRGSSEIHSQVSSSAAATTVWNAGRVGAAHGEAAHPLREGQENPIVVLNESGPLAQVVCLQNLRRSLEARAAGVVRTRHTQTRIPGSR